MNSTQFERSTKDSTQVKENEDQLSDEEETPKVEEEIVEEKPNSWEPELNLLKFNSVKQFEELNSNLIP